LEKLIKLESQQEAQALLGTADRHLKTIEKECKVKITLRGDHLKINGPATHLKKAGSLIAYVLSSMRSSAAEVGALDVGYLIRTHQNPRKATPDMPGLDLAHITGTKNIGPRTPGQREYVEAIKKFDVVFGIGPAGTGKTYLAMACAVEALNKKEVRRIILTRPALEAGESLGFLPGDMYEKISPYLRPLYDALYDMMEAERIEKYLETGIIEVAPLAYMRGRTLNDAFIILDEAQNCTHEQMKMFLTRLGFDSKAVITGDMTQSDLPDGRPMGLLQAQDILQSIRDIKFIYFSGSDVVRHPLVQRIIEAYDTVARKKQA
jgi:phosphate starvation-inducible PhoH-like protein